MSPCSLNAFFSFCSLEKNTFSISENIAGKVKSVKKFFSAGKLSCSGCQAPEKQDLIRKHISNIPARNATLKYT